MAWDKKSYDAEYYKKNIFCKRLPFNRSIPEDMELLDFLERQQPNATQYLKQLIRKDMERQRTETADPPPDRIALVLVNGGFEDAEAIREAEENNHAIATEWHKDRWEITVDLDARKIIREIDHRPEKI